MTTTERETDPTVLSEEDAAPFEPSGVPAAGGEARRRRMRRLAWSVLGVGGAGFLALALYLAPVGAERGGLIDAVPAMEETTRVYDRNGAVIYEFFDKKRTVVPLARMSPDLLHAIAAAEDRSFYRHPGIDLRALVRATWVNLRAGKIRQGGSTLTQQLARMTFLSPERTFARKLVELRIALKIERVFSKDEILEHYANRVYLGSGFYGVEAAAQGYFGRSASLLDLDQAALVAGMAQAPTVYSPYTNPRLAIRRRNSVLDSMVQTGFITSARAEAMKGRPLAVLPREHELRKANYAIDYLRDILVESFGTERVFNGGLKVYTTLDSRIQAAAEQTVESSLSMLERQHKELRPVARAEYLKTHAGETESEPDYVQGALLSMNAHSGEIYALVGGRNFAESQFNRAVRARRQPGSAFKPFVYAAALRMGMLPSSQIQTDETEFSTPQGIYQVANSEGQGYGEVSLRVAMRKSINTAAVALGQQIGLQSIVRSARSFGIEDPLPEVASLPLGACEVSLLEMVRAFSVFPNGGAWVQPILVTRVEDRHGGVLKEFRPAGRYALDPQTTYLMTTMLVDAVDRGTGTAVRAAGFKGPVGGKTGTTNDYRDAWFIGFTPDVVTGVWVGFDAPRTIMNRGYGGTIAAPIWASFMKEVSFPGKAALVFRIPPGIVRVPLCPDTNQRATTACYALEPDGTVLSPYPDYFPEDRVPPVCTVHGVPTGESILERAAVSSPRQ